MKVTRAQRARVRRLAAYWKVAVAPSAVCRGHSAPLDFLSEWVYQRPPVSLVLGPRGGGKSYLSALATHIDSMRYDRHGTRVLGGSEAQSAQIYDALKDFNYAVPNNGLFTSFTKTAATYTTGSDVSILAASSKSVRGPHVPSLRLDEVDEIDPDIRESAMGMCMERNGYSPQVSMTSTWHRLGGPMAELIEKSRSGSFPFHTFCAFEILERCPPERSGPNLENCPSCPLVRWCHDSHDGIPKAKKSQGHYTIDALIQKTQVVSERIFAADYLCLGPKADGVWFANFDTSKHVSIDAEYDSNLNVWLAIDSGVVTGAVWFQVRQSPGGVFSANIFADYLSEGLSAEANARAILEISRTKCNGRVHRYVTDPAGGSRNPVGPTVMAEYERCGVRPLERWPVGSVADGLMLVESFVRAADGSSGLSVHPRCTPTIQAFQAYRRAKRSGQWQDYPEDPQHPHEDLMDSVRGGFRSAFPEGRRPQPKLERVNARRVF